MPSRYGPFRMGGRRATRRSPRVGRKQPRSRPSVSRVARSLTSRKLYSFGRWVDQSLFVDPLTGQPALGGSQSGWSLGTTAPNDHNTIGVGLAGSFSMNDLPSVGEYSTLFDSYRIRGIEVEVNYSFNTGWNSDNASSTLAMPSVMWVEDNDDAVAPSTLSILQQYQSAKTYTFRGDNRPLRFTIRPHAATQVYRPGVVNAYSQMAADTWLDFTYPDVPHYGLKMFFSNVGVNPTNANFTFRMRYIFDTQTVR